MLHLGMYPVRFLMLYPTYAAYESKHVHVCSAKQILFPRIRHKQILGINAGIVLSNKNPPVNITWDKAKSFLHPEDELAKKAS